jgi:hypothetical protein
VCVCACVCLRALCVCVCVYVCVSVRVCVSGCYKRCKYLIVLTSHSYCYIQECKIAAIFSLFFVACPINGHFEHFQFRTVQRKTVRPHFSSSNSSRSVVVLKHKGLHMSAARAAPSYRDWVMFHVYGSCLMCMRHVSCVCVISCVYQVYVGQPLVRLLHIGIESCLMCMSHVSCVWVMSCVYQVYIGQPLARLLRDLALKQPINH